ncbi:23S ribosomal RNA methyltransferase Erm [Mycobacterium sp. SMC-4]|uniref:23S ribosomal RNA methyltransferase Erm n=1 Tax=Mycobacterium sp. SMC-4 TaxID=2857059 RepID=UPI0021B1EFDD|nr:23S ribosomal RNA methyltransferase Erm [Mycobacterium sp. SMC-4]UXA19150.1 23S ribosomal RNA methyltransferase Erm [Mycobacterium sp. SMC-4]
MPTYSGGRHEHGQNFLIDPAIRDRIVGLVAATSGPIVEIGPGRGALTFELQHLGRPLTAVEIDARHARWLRSRAKPSTAIVEADFLRWRLPAHPHVVVGNLPFHLTTAVLRRLLHASQWTQSMLLVQWEVARRRAAVGGATMMTAQWWPWIEFGLECRVPADAFRPRPTVDGGLMVMTRRVEPLVARPDRGRYQAFVHAVFTGRGRDLAAVLSGVCDRRTRRAVTGWVHRHGLQGARPRDLTAAQWTQLFELAGPSRK